MTAGQFALGLVRLLAILLPLAVTARSLRLRYFSLGGALALLVDVVLSLSLLLVAAEALGLIGLDRPIGLIPLLILIAISSRLWVTPRGATGTSSRPPQTDSSHVTPRGSLRDIQLLSLAAALVIVVGQWCVEIADSLGSGMSNFDTLWYHMPFAARFAQSGYVTGIQFTQADPFVAYYPANSELFHAVGIIALGSDFLSPLLNIFWLALALLASWCLGRPWRVARLTLIAGCLAFSLPVLSTTQPGEAFNDTFGLAALLAAAALVANRPDDLRVLAVAGLALGLAVGTKYTFIVPAFVLAAAMVVRAKRGKRGSVLAALALPAILTAGWWYLQDLIEVGNPLGLRLHLGPITLPGPNSPLANALQQTVISQVGHLSLWGSRFIPGLNHSLGVLWPLVLLLCLLAVVAGVVRLSDGIVRVLALSAALAGLSYLLLPTGASGIEQGTNLFEVNLRYLMPALVLMLLMLPIVLRLRAPRMIGVIGPVLVLMAVVTQFEHALWPTQPARHLASLLAAAVALAVVVLWQMGRLRRPRMAVLVPAVIGVLLLMGVASFAVQRHYFNRRYLTGDSKDPGTGEIYRWASGVAHSRIALYGTVLQYPLYGARDTNYVGYLGEAAPSGGFRPIESCRTWRATLAAGRYRWVVLDYPGPTLALPVSWTQSDPAMHLVLHPEAGAFVFQVTGRPRADLCPA
jgi:hypothetical protein